MKVRIVAHTVVVPNNMRDASDLVWEPEVEEGNSLLDQGTALTEFAGRACYESWKKPNPATATPMGYCHHILEVGHLSVTEHAAVSLHITDVSRSLTHELVRHRHFSYSQLSQRYAARSGAAVVPPLFRGHQETEEELQAAWEAAGALYERLVARWTPIALQLGYEATRARKVVREAARSVLPNMTPTKIVVTGNHRAWREFLEKRGSIHADAEIRELALEIYWQLNAMEPALYQDFTIERGPLNEQILVRRDPE